MDHTIWGTGLSGQAQILIVLLFVAVVAAIGAIWQLANMRGYNTRGRRRTSPPGKAATQRQSDRQALTAPEKRLYKEAQRMLKENKVPAAARIFEQLGMPREAIQCLEDAGMIHEAASILIRMQRHNRAGVIYARHGLWNDAAQCFKTANMPAEAAKCFREAGNSAAAGQFFETAGRPEDAAACYEESGDFLKAARILFRNDHRSAALPLYSQAAGKQRDVRSLEMRDDELDVLVKEVSKGNDDTNFIRILIGFNRIGEVVLSLLQNGNVKLAGKLFSQSETDIGPMLMSEINYADESANRLADMFVDVSSFDYAGRVLERLEDFEAAAATFEDAGDYERAAHCYERAGNFPKARAAKSKGKSGQALPRRGKQSPRGFSLANIQDTGSNDQDPGSEDSTAIVDISSKIQSSPPPAPPAPMKDTKATFTPREVKHTIPTPPQPEQLGIGKFSLSENIEERTPPPAPRSVSNPTPPRMPNTAKNHEEGHEQPEEHTRPVVTQPISIDDGKAAFHRAKFFADLDYRQKNKLWDIGRTLQLGASETILSYNDEPTGIYVIISGNVSCYKQVKDADTSVDQMGEAESFGELWLLADQPTTVKFVASVPTNIRVIDRNSFNELLDSDGSIARKLYKRFTMRLLKRLLKPQNSNKNQAAS